MAFKNKLLIAAILITSTSVMADEFALGVGAAFNESPFKGYNENVTAIPLISYEGENFYVRQASAGWILWRDAKNELSLTSRRKRRPHQRQQSYQHRSLGQNGDLLSDPLSL
jgi:outer membrane protein